MQTSEFILCYEASVKQDQMLRGGLGCKGSETAVQLRRDMHS